MSNIIESLERAIKKKDYTRVFHLIAIFIDKDLRLENFIDEKYVFETLKMEGSIYDLTCIHASETKDISIPFLKKLLRNLSSSLTLGFCFAHSILSNNQENIDFFFEQIDNLTVLCLIGNNEEFIQKCLVVAEFELKKCGRGLSKFSNYIRILTKKK
jgi:hypothetical protein